MRRLVLALAIAAPPVAASADGPVACDDFRTRLVAELRKLDAAPAASFRADAGAEAVVGIPGIEGQMTCREGILGQLVLNAAGDGANLQRPAAAALIALDPDMDASAANAMAAALKAQITAAQREATSEWGPYELTWSAPDNDRASFTLNMAEN